MFDSDNETIVVILKMIGCNSIDMSWYLQWFNHPVYDAICLYKPWFTIMGSKIEKRGYGACRSAALSEFLEVDDRHSFFIFMRDAIVQLCCCNWSHRSIGSSQELTLRATIAILGSVSSRQLLFQRRCYNESGKFWKLTDEDVTAYQDRLASYLKKMLQRIRNVLQLTWRRCYNVSEIYCKLHEEDVTTYQGRLEGYIEKRLQHIRNILQVTWRRCYNVSGTSCKLLEEDATTYQERLASYLTKMLQCSRKSLLTTQTTGRYYTPTSLPKKKRNICKSDNSPPPPRAPSPKTIQC